MSLILAKSAPKLEVKTFGIVPIPSLEDELKHPNIWIRTRDSKEVDFEIDFIDFNQILDCYFGFKPSADIFSIDEEEMEFWFGSNNWAENCILFKFKTNDANVFAIDETDFKVMAQYVYTNTDLIANDVRLNYLGRHKKKSEKLKRGQDLFDWLLSLKLVDGFNTKNKRLAK